MMNKEFRTAVSVLILFIFYSIFIISQSFAAEKSTEINIKVEGPVATASGLAAPLASVTAMLKEFRLASTTADEKGYFLLQNVGIYEGATSVCFGVVDSKSYGVSDSCIEFKPAVADVNFSDLFLAPTLGLAKNKIAVGESAIIRGFSIPEARIELFAKGSEKKILDADKSGYFGTVYKNLKEGVYYFSAVATHNGKRSLSQRNQVKLEVGISDVGTGTGTTEESTGSSLWLWLMGIIISGAAVGVAAFVFFTRTKRGKLMWSKFQKSKIYARVYLLLLKYKIIKPKSVQTNQTQNSVAPKQVPQNPQKK